MVNREQKFGGKSARDLTAEIEAATSAEVVAQERAAEGAQEASVEMRAAEGEQKGATREEEGLAGLGRRDENRELQGLGRKVIASGELSGRGARRGATASVLAREIGDAKKELARDDLELKEAERFVGDESSLQVIGRLEDDVADQRTEDRKGLALENRVLADSQEKVAKAVAAEVDELMAQPRYRPMDLLRYYNRERGRSLLALGRRIGDRN